MTDDYLWDRTGEPDPDIRELERALAPLRYRQRALRPGLRHPLWGLAAAAAFLAGAGLLLLRTAVAPPQPTAWHLADGNSSAALHAGQWLRPGRNDRVTIEADAVGRVDLGPQSQLRVGAHRLDLRRGDLHAFIWAPAGAFVVETPSARTIDLGCEYTLHVDRDGRGLLRVSMGWVAFQFHGRESFIPAGAACVTRPGRGPGIPFYEDSDARFRQRLAAFEAGDDAALGALLHEARPRDGLTLWHLLTRVPAANRGAVFDRFAELVGLAEGVTRAAIERLDAHAIDLCWNALGLQNTGWWRGWERPWPGDSQPRVPSE
jgi:hypothetical protein